jgi:hypothetical protein
MSGMKGIRIAEQVLLMEGVQESPGLQPLTSISKVAAIIYDKRQVKITDIAVKLSITYRYVHPMIYNHLNFHLL